MKDLLTRKTATISACGLYRYRLTRDWGPGWLLPFVMLNPSTADADADDPTIRRCIAFARREGFGGIVVANLFAWRAADPSALPYSRARAIGPENDEALRQLALATPQDALPIICAWGAHGIAVRRSVEVKRLLSGTGARLTCLGKTAKGHPRHPLYVKGDQPFEAFA